MDIRTRKFLGMEIYIWCLMPSVLLATACGVGGKSSEESSLLEQESSPVGKEIDILAVKREIMEKTRFPLANIANALGYGWVSGCGAEEVGGDYRLDLPLKGDSAWDPSLNSEQKCDGFKAKERTKIVYKNWRAYQRDIQYSEPKVKSTNLVEIDQIVFEAASEKYTANPKKTYTLLNTISHRALDTVRFGSEFGVEISATFFGIGAKSHIKFSQGTDHSTEQQTLETKTSVTEAAASFQVPANTKLVVRVLREDVTSDVTYDATVDIKSDVALNGFMRWRDCGGNWHIQHRGSKARPRVEQIFGDGTTPFWEDIVRHRENNLSPFDWKKMEEENDCFAHGPVVQSALAEMTHLFASSAIHSVRVRGAIQEVKGVRFVLKPEFVPVDGHADRKPTEQPKTSAQAKLAAEQPK